MEVVMEVTFNDETVESHGTIQLIGENVFCVDGDAGTYEISCGFNRNTTSEELDTTIFWSTNGNSDEHFTRMTPQNPMSSMNVRVKRLGTARLVKIIVKDKCSVQCSYIIRRIGKK